MMKTVTMVSTLLVMISAFLALYVVAPPVRIGMEIAVVTSNASPGRASFSVGVHLGRNEILASADTVAHLGVGEGRRMCGFTVTFIDGMYVPGFQGDHLHEDADSRRYDGP